jgi:hypothetical protein
MRLCSKETSGRNASSSIGKRLIHRCARRKGGQDVEHKRFSRPLRGALALSYEQSKYPELRRARRPELLIVDGAPGLEGAIAAVWDGVPVQRCTVHKHRSLLAHAPERLHEEITADYNDMIYAASARRSRRGARLSSANGGSSIAPSPTACRKPATGSSRSRVCRQVNGAAFAPPMPSSGYTRNSSDASRRRPCCHRPTPRRCSSGRCLPPARSTCEKSTVGKRSPPNPSISQLTSPLDQIASVPRRLPNANSNRLPDGTVAPLVGSVNISE